MELFANLALGFDTALTLSNLQYCLTGVFLGTAIGVLPGLALWLDGNVPGTVGTRGRSRQRRGGSR